jgi:hypothetical protein
MSLIFLNNVLKAIMRLAVNTLEIHNTFFLRKIFLAGVCIHVGAGPQEVWLLNLLDTCRHFNGHEKSIRVTLIDLDPNVPSELARTTD